MLASHSLVDLISATRTQQALSPASPVKRPKLVIPNGMTHRYLSEEDSQNVDTENLPKFENDASRVKRVLLSCDEPANESAPEEQPPLSQNSAASFPSEATKDSNSFEIGQNLIERVLEGETVDGASFESCGPEMLALFDLLCKHDVLEKLGDQVYRKRCSTQVMPPLKYDSKAFYHHPAPDATPSSRTNRLATKIALGEPVSCEEISFLPPAPHDMLQYQLRCLDMFMKRYNDFYRVVTRAA